ncbi:uncharacterized protein LOC120770127 [Bactrocera tryoni]|uniref:uncharacterized protein LOC120770127 n=1 Tax=Bactrocera tryoni TaxID=59916 RepID=UPI001A976A92|nr:uncharacterized protein LOC120770127 [Bactrocera tryoni]
MLKQNIMAEEESDKKWTHERKLLLLNKRLSNEVDFCAKRKKKSVLWEKVLREIKGVDAEFPFSRDDITRKFMNFMVTYKRIKRRNKTSGEAAATWEFFDQMDEIYGTRTDIVVPEELLDSSLSDILSGINDHIADDANSDTDKEPPRKRARCDVLDFLRAESQEDKKLLKEFLECEKGKLKVEREKVEEMKKLR